MYINIIGDGVESWDEARNEFMRWWQWNICDFDRKNFIFKIK